MSEEEGGEERSACAVCGVPAQEACALCEQTSYCGPQHQRQHWPLHRAACSPLRVATSPQLGRYLVATRDLKAGELLLKEQPVAVGPRAGGGRSPLCLGCWRRLPAPPPTCPRCSAAPLCPGGSCQHDESECCALREAGEAGARLLRAGVEAVLPLRCLLLAAARPDNWRQLLQLEAHAERRGPGTAVWSHNDATVVQPLKEAGLLRESEETCQRVCGVLDVNSFEVRAPHGGHDQLRAVYARAALMAHDCVANTHLAVDDNFVMTVHAALPIPKGAAVCFNYTNVLQGTAERREHLLEGKYFECGCARCRDPTELGTHLSSLRCPRCRKGLVCALQDQPNVWRCCDCGRSFCGGMARCALWCARDAVEAALEAAEAEDESGGARVLEAAAATGAQLPRKLLARQVQLCRGLLPLLAVVEPGISRLRGIALYELQGSLAELARREHAAGELTMQQLVERLEEAEGALKDALAALLFEPALSPEGRLARAAMLELRDLREEIHDLRREAQPQPKHPQRKDRRRHK
ncbi:SET domain-containing protein SmydA-8-like [Schistocerca serialis cubense]|uniref:SET domain-containing protein SmydA-8-like n=1 Tax=Schistocerca serialis cubense TaxID=2023355 RepID=UPI00214E4674|nr:SET domain-containing protein SmydA-8-like [Schistocerca serialis cubense]